MASVPMFGVPSLNGANACLHSRRRQNGIPWGSCRGVCGPHGRSSIEIDYRAWLDLETCTRRGTGFVVFTWGL